MTGIPRDPSWCSMCRCPEHYGDGSPCSAHRGAGGHPAPYDGPHVYEPSNWVSSVVGQRYRGSDGTYVCDGYDPRHGFWMRDVATGEQRNVSERAIDRTYHREREPR